MFLEVSLEVREGRREEGGKEQGEGGYRFCVRPAVHSREGFPTCMLHADLFLP